MKTLRTLHYAVLVAAILSLGSTEARTADRAGGEDGGGMLFPASLAVDPSGNSVLEPAETVVLAPTWNSQFMPVSATGVTSNFTGPAGGVYLNPDSQANYGTFPDIGPRSCLDTGDCYTIGVTATTRPATHWDSTIHETVAASWQANWTLHVGASFPDLPVTNPFYRFVETLLHRSVTSGCTASAYCGSAGTTRGQMAVFVLVAKHGAAYVPPACGATPMFTDVPVASPFCRWVEELARRGVTSGCAPGMYCPSGAVTREQMAIFVLRTLDPALSPPACGTPVFADVPATSPFCRWIEELARRGIVTGCGGGNYCPAAIVTREQMAVFLVGTFSLRLY